MIGEYVEWQGRRFEVSGYASSGGAIFVLWLRDREGEFRLKGNQLKDVKF